MRVIFFQVKTPKEKIDRLIETVTSHFEKGENSILFVEDEKAQHYVDDLLWKMPNFSFLPHAISDFATKEKTVITRSKTNINEAKYAFNLCSTPLLIDSPFKIIYEYEDLTSPGKQQASQNRFDAYKKASFLIEARSL